MRYADIIREVPQTSPRCHRVPPVFLVGLLLGASYSQDVTSVPEPHHAALPEKPHLSKRKIAVHTWQVESVHSLGEVDGGLPAALLCLRPRQLPGFRLTVQVTALEAKHRESQAPRSLACGHSRFHPYLKS